MKAYELSKKPLKEFKDYFESDPDSEKFTNEQDSLNILDFCLINNNYDVVKYLLENHDYNLEEELQKNLENIPLIYFVSFSYLLKTTLELNEKFEEDFAKTIDLLIENQINMPLFDNEEYEKNFFESYSSRDFALLNEPYFFTLIEKNYIDKNLLQLYLENIITCFCKKETSVVNSLLIDILENYDFSETQNAGDFYLLMRMFACDFSNLKIDEVLLKNALAKMKHNYLKTNHMTSEDIEGKIVSIYINDHESRQEFIYHVETMCNIKREDNKYLNLKNLLIRINPLINIQDTLTEEVIQACIKNNLFSIYKDIRNVSNKLLENDSQILSKGNKKQNAEYEELSQKDIIDFNLLEREIIAEKYKSSKKEISKKRL